MLSVHNEIASSCLIAEETCRAELELRFYWLLCWGKGRWAGGETMLFHVPVMQQYCQERFSASVAVFARAKGRVTIEIRLG